MDQRVLKFQSVHRHYKSGQIEFHEWGPIKGGFSAPAQISGYDHIGNRQFTGLLDMRGKEIYEGDKLRILYTDWPSNTDDSVSLEDYKKSISAYGYVAWDEHSTGWIVRVKSKYSVDEDGTVMSSIIHGTHGEREVIGHIYE